MHDWQLCGLCCQLMWNLLSGDSDFNVQYSFLLQTLQDLTGNENYVKQLVNLDIVITKSKKKKLNLLLSLV